MTKNRQNSFFWSIWAKFKIRTTMCHLNGWPTAIWIIKPTKYSFWAQKWVLGQNDEKIVKTHFFGSIWAKLKIWTTVCSLNGWPTAIWNIKPIKYSFWAQKWVLGFGSEWRNTKHFLVSSVRMSEYRVVEDRNNRVSCFQHSPRLFLWFCFAESQKWLSSLLTFAHHTEFTYYICV